MLSRQRPFVMTEIYIDGQNHDVPSFWLRAEPEIIRLVTSFACVVKVLERDPTFLVPFAAGVKVFLDTRYDPREAWKWIYDELTIETRRIDLNESLWAIEDEDLDE